MGKKETEKISAEATIRTIRRKTRRKYSAEDKIRIVIEGLRGEETIAELCRREGIAQSLYLLKNFSKRVSHVSREIRNGKPPVVK